MTMASLTLTPTDEIGTLTTLGLAAEVDAQADATNAPRVLIVGDGNFSFARAFLRKHADRIHAQALHVTATSLDTHDELLRMYPNAGDILEELSLGGVRVIHGINATRLETYPVLTQPPSPPIAIVTADITGGGYGDGDAIVGGNDAAPMTEAPFDRIVFNFPHFAEGGSRRNKIHRHRQLLVEFFASVAQVLHAEGQVWVTLCAGQGGTALDPKPRAWGDTWQVVHGAAASGFLLANVHECPVEELAALGYYSVGYQLRERGFWTADSVSHVFIRQGPGRRAMLPIEWERDMSFWVTPAFDEDWLACMVRAFFPPEDMSVAIRKLDDYHCGKTQRHAVTYRLCIASYTLALCKDDVNDRATRALAAIESSEFADSRAN